MAVQWTKGFFVPQMICTLAWIVYNRVPAKATRCSAALLLALAATAISIQAQGPPASPISLQALLDSVSIRYPLVLAAQARVRAAHGSRRTAGAFSNPIVGYQIDDNVDNTPLPGGGTTRALERERIATVTLPLEPLYQRGPRIRRADAEVRATKDDAVAARQRAALDATKAFYRTALAQVSDSTAGDLLVWLDSLVTYNRSRVKEGVASEGDLIRTQLERDRAAADATAQHAELAQARADLSTFAGTSSSEAQSLNVLSDARPLALPLELQMPAGSTSIPNTTNNPAPQTKALLDRAEVRAARERVAAAAADISSQRTMILRQLGATIGLKQTAGTSSMIAGVSIPFPIFDANRGEIERAGAEREAAAYELASQKRSVSAEVNGAFEAARLLTERMTTMASGTHDFLARADEARRIALGEYREGAVPLFQVIDAARAWNDARLTYYRTLYAQHQSVLALVFAEGGDLLGTLPALIRPVTPNR